MFVLNTIPTEFKIKLGFYGIPPTLSLNSFPNNIIMTRLSFNGPNYIQHGFYRATAFVHTYPSVIHTTLDSLLKAKAMRASFLLYLFFFNGFWYTDHHGDSHAVEVS